VAAAEETIAERTETEAAELETTLSTPRYESDDGCNDIANLDNEINTPSPSDKPQMDETTLERLIAEFNAYERDDNIWEKFKRGVGR